MKEADRRALCGEGRAAAAGGGRVGIGELKTAAVQAGDKIYDGAAQVGSATAVDIDSDAVKLEDHVVRLGLVVEIQLVRKARHR